MRQRNEEENKQHQIQTIKQRIKAHKNREGNSNIKYATIPQ